MFERRLLVLTCAAIWCALAAPAFADVELGEPPPSPAPERDAATPPPIILDGEVDAPTRAPLPLTMGLLSEALFTTFDGHIEKVRDGIGDRISLDDDVPLDRTGPGMRFSGWFGLAGSFGIEAGYLRVRYEGRGTLDDDLDHAGEVLFAGERVELVDELQTVWFGMRYEALLMDTRTVVGLGALWASQRVAIRSREDPDRRGRGTVDAWTPYIGILFDAPLVDRDGNGVGLELETRLFGYTDDETDLGYFEIHARLYAQLAGTLRATAGLMWLGIDYRDIDGSDEELIVELGAVTVGLAIGF